MDLFWTQQDDLPAGTGYSWFGKEHIISLIVIILFIIFFLRWYDHLTANQQRNVCRWIPAIMLVAEAGKDLLVAYYGKFYPAYLPLHLCGLGIFVFLSRELVSNPGVKQALGEISLILILPGAIAALLFPDWTMYPVWNFFNLYSYSWHTFLIIYPLCLKHSGLLHVRITHLWYELVFLLAIAVPIYLFDQHTGYNYLFILYPVEPVKTLTNWMGKEWRIGYAVIVLAGILLSYGVQYGISYWKKSHQ